MQYLDDISAQHHILSIRLAPDGFSFFVLNVPEHNVVAFKYSPIDIQQDAVVVALNALRSEEVFTYPFQEVRVLIDFPSVTTVPSSLYDENCQEELFKMNVDVGMNEFVIANHSSAYDLEVLFSIPKELYTFFNKNFSKILFVHKLTLLLDQANQYQNKSQEQLLVSYGEHHFTVVGLKNNSLVYHNCFNLNCNEDFVYYLLLVFQELGFDQYQAHVLLDGVIDSSSNKVQVIREYVKHVDFAERPSGYQFSEAIQEAPAHYYSNLLTLPNCVL